MSVERIIKSKQLELIRDKLGLLAEEGSERIKKKLAENKFYLLEKVREKLIETYTLEEINTPQKFNVIRNSAWSLLEEEAEKGELNLYLDSYDKAEILELLVQRMFGYGVLDPLIQDASITEIMVNGLEKIFVERNGKIELARNKRGELVRFHNSEELLYVIEKIVAPVNRKVDESNPIVDARLPNGFRVNIVLNPLSLDGHLITIRKFPESPYTMEQLVNFGTLPPILADFLASLVKARYNLIISGGTGSGKTTFLNALSNFIGREERVVTIEDSAELKLSGLNNLIRLETRPPNIEGKGEITMRSLVRTALRMRPDRIIVGEVRGGEALDMLQAMNTGHDGSLSTGHANSALDMLSRLETMVLMAGMELPLLSIRQQIASAVEIIIHLSKLQDGTRRVVQVTEILGVNEKGYLTQELFHFCKDSESKDNVGRLEYTGKEMQRLNKFIFSGITPLDLKNL